jgi:co-chaperonin GroES (HSP10)
MIQFNQKSLGHRVILKPRIEKETKSGIVIARDERSQAVNTNQGEVFMIGPSCWDNMEKPDIKVGDLVYYARYGAMTIKPEGSEDFLVLCNDEDLLVGYTENE